MKGTVVADRRRREGAGCADRDHARDAHARGPGSRRRRHRAGVGREADRRSCAIVGRGVLPEFSGAGAAWAKGATMTFEGARPSRTRRGGRRHPRACPARSAPAPRSSPSCRARSSAIPYLPAKPSDLVDLGRVGGLPSIIAALLGIMAIATLAHALLLVGAPAAPRPRDLQGARLPAPAGVGRDRVAGDGHRGDRDRRRCPARHRRRPLELAGVRATARRARSAGDAVPRDCARSPHSRSSSRSLTAAIPARVAARTPAAVALRAE